LLNSYRYAILNDTITKAVIADKYPSIMKDTITTVISSSFSTDRTSRLTTEGVVEGNNECMPINKNKIQETNE